MIAGTRTLCSHIIQVIDSEFKDLDEIEVPVTLRASHYIAVDALQITIEKNKDLLNVLRNSAFRKQD